MDKVYQIKVGKYEVYHEAVAKDANGIKKLIQNAVDDWSLSQVKTILSTTIDLEAMKYVILYEDHADVIEKDMYDIIELKVY